jgi:PHP family Zn ribbon phosphoesterase
MRCFACNNQHNTEPDPKTDRFYCPKCGNHITNTILSDVLDDDLVDVTIEDVDLDREAQVCYTSTPVYEEGD